MDRPFIPDGDPAIDDVRRARHELSAMFDHDPTRLLAHLRSRQNLRPEGLISYEKQPAESTEDDVDPIVDPVREARRKISEELGNDPMRLIDYYQQAQEELRDRLIPEPTQETKS